MSDNVDTRVQEPGVTEEVKTVVPGQVVAPEDTVLDPDVVPSSLDDYPEHGAVAHNTNDAPALIEASNDEKNNPIVSKKHKRDTSLDRKKGETQAEYNERVPVALQPVQPAPTHNYLGEEL